MIKLNSKIINKLWRNQSFKLSVCFLVIFSLVVLGVFYLVFNWLPRQTSEKYIAKLDSAFNLEIEELNNKNKLIANSPDIIEGLATENLSLLTKAIPRQIIAQQVDLIGILNKDGIVLTRTQPISLKGDNFFLNSPLGRSMAKFNGSVSSVEINSNDRRQLLFINSQPVNLDNNLLGYVLTSYIADDNLAAKFFNNYLDKRVNLAFYTKQNGVVGSSFDSDSKKNLFAAYFYPDSPWIKDGLDNSILRTPQGDLILVRNIILSGQESSPGGVLIFIELKNVWLWGTIGLIFPVIIFFVAWFLFNKHYKKKIRLNFLCCPLVVILLGFYFIVSFVFYTILFNNFPLLKPGIYPLYNSTLHFQPEGGVLDRRFAQKISVILDTGNESINAIRLALKYNPLEIKVQSVDMDRSICKYFILSEHNSQSGDIVMECMIPNPGFKGNSAVLADLFIKSLEDTTVSTVYFSEDTQILANDGLATNVLRLANDSTFYFENSADRSKNKGLVVFSPSHSNPERWYSNRYVNLSWAPNYSAVVSEVDQLCPEALVSSPPFYKKLKHDGIYNFLVSAKDEAGLDVFGNIIIKIDTVPPEKVELKSSGEKVKPGEIVRFEASAQDGLSGLQKVFYIKINDGIFFPIGDEIHIPFLQAGTYYITLRAYDKAGNYKDVTKKIIVRRWW